MRALIIGLGLLVIIILGTLFIVPGLVPSETYRATIEQQLTQEFGRDVSIDGDVSLSTFPVIKAKTGRASIANPTGFSRESLATLTGLEARIKLFPLFAKHIEIAQFTLVEPDILLERRPNGEVNWEIGTAGLDAETGSEPTAAPSGPFQRDGRYAAIDPSLGAFQIQDGRLLYIDGLADTRRELSNINMQLSLPAMTKALELSGTLVMDGDPLTLDVTLDNPRDFLDGREARLKANMETDEAMLSLDGIIPPGLEVAFDGSMSGALSDGQINGQYTGQARLTDTVSLTGDLSVTGQSLRALASGSGTSLPPSTDVGSVFEAFALSGSVSGPVGNMALTDAMLSLDQLSATGRFGLSITGPRPKLTGTLALPGLDLRPYMAAYSAQQPESAIQPWSTTAIATEGLRAIDADLSLTTPNIKLSRLSLGATQARAVLNNGLLTTTIPKMGLYGGSGKAKFVLDGRTADPKIDLTAGLNSLEAQGFLGAVAGFTQATGMGTTEISLSGSGASQAAIMQSLTGVGNFSVKDGSISGIDAREFLTGLQQSLTTRALPGGLGPTKKTQFKNLIGEFSMTDGVAKIDAFALSAAQVQVEGSGQVDLGQQTLDVRLRPKTVGENAKGIAAFGIPLRFTGPFGAAKPQLDSEFLTQIIQARATAEAQNLISDRIGGAGGDLVGGVLGSILGGNRQTPTPPAEPQTPDSTETPEATDTEPTVEERVEDKILGLFGRKQGD